MSYASHRQVLLLILTVLLNSYGANAQSQGKSKRVSTGIVFIEPVALIDVYNGPCVKLGVEYFLKKRWSVYLLQGIYWEGGVYRKAGVKLYLDRYRETSIGCNFFSKQLTHSVTDNIKRFDTGRGYTVSGDPFSYDIKKEVWGFNLEVAEQVRGKHFSFEYFAGIGFRNRTATSSISDSVYRLLYHFHESIIEGYSNGPSYRQILPTITLGIRLGYVIHRKRKTVTSAVNSANK